MSRRGMTLIELLIVTAIMAIMSAALISTILMPLQEQAAVEIQAEQSRGIALAVSALTEDFHNAESAIFEEEGELILTSQTQELAYFIDENEVLRRVAGDDRNANGGTPVASTAREFNVEISESNEFANVFIKLSDQKYQRTFETGNSFTVLIGQRWMGEAK